MLLLRATPALRCPALWSGSMRSMSASGSAVVDQMLTYVWTDLQGQGQPAIDVLRSGLAMQPGPSQGYDSGRLQLATSLVYAAEHDWAQAASASSSAAAAFACQQLSGLSGLSGLLAVRALLVAGRDGEAAAAAAAAAQQQGAPRLAPLLQQLLVRQASSPRQLLAAEAAALQEQLQAAATEADGAAVASGLLLAAGHKAAGDLALEQGSLDAAAASYEAAAAAAATSGGSAELVAVGASSQLQQELAADIAAAAAQVCMRRQQWDAAEESLSTALQAAEVAAGERSPLLAQVLLLLGSCYARSARVMYAEGMLAEAAKLLGGSQPARLVDAAAGSSSHQAVHPSLKAALCWRFCQLLTALPNRSTEAEAWSAAAQELWERAAPGASLQEVLGDDVALKGQGQHGHGRGALVSLFTRRLLQI